MCTKKEDPLFQFYLEDIESPAKDNYAQWLMIEPKMVLEDDEAIDIDLEGINIKYRRIAEYKGMTYAFNYFVEFDGYEYHYHPDVDSIVRVYPKEIIKIIYTEEM